jgi:hypothetical protein
MKRPTTPFLCAIFGIAMTLFSWYGPWAWPAAPAFFILETFFGGSYHELPFAGRAAVLVLLIVVNAGAWAITAAMCAAALARLVRRTQG